MEPIIMKFAFGCITGIIALGACIYSVFAANQRGIILSNSYLLLSKAQREKADTKAEYRFCSTVFGLIGVMMALLSVYIFTMWKWAFIAMWVVIASTLVFVIKEAAKSEKKKS